MTADVKGRISVVVPSYNVERYLDECVRSIVASSYPDIEVIIVNDGSKDSTGALADNLAAEFANVNVLHKVNQGLGAARNSGLALASGEYIAFVDSDDIVPPEAYTVMRASLAESGSQFAVGAVERFNSTRRWEPWFVAEAHGARRARVRGGEFPPILWNVFAWSKLFRKDFFVNTLGGFPEGVLYEDQEISATAYLSGKPFDVVPEVVYWWRSREDGTSITENKTSLYDLSQRLEVAKKTASVVERLGSPEVIEYWYRKLLNEDLWWYFRVVPQTDQQYWETLRESVTAFVEKAPAASVYYGPEKRTDLITLCVQGNRSSFIRRLQKA